MVISPERALEELNSDWTASQELADVLMRKYKLPFRDGHHFASEVVTYAKANNIKPLDFPYEQARRIYADAMKDSKYGAELPMSEAEFRSTLDPVAIVKNRATSGGPQPAEMDRMIKEARAQLASQDAWIKARRAHIRDSLAELDKQFDALVASAPKEKGQ
ncbi:Argininosuccinate lyase [compost metagenome]